MNNLQGSVLVSLINLSGYLVLVYLNFWVLLPRYYDKKKYFHYAVGIFILLIITAAWRFFMGWKLVNFLQWGDIKPYFTPTLAGGFFIGAAFVLLISLPLRLVENWFKSIDLEKELKTQKLEAELRFLKAQVNPHFLFNALNNIYALSFIQSEKAPEMILKLSDMMSYMLYDCKEDQVLLSSEINYLRNYIDLQQLKKDGEQQIAFDINGDVSGIMITPMLFIPFFENAFKHGNVDDTTNGWLKSTFTIENGGIDFFIENSVAPERTSLQKGGVGLENIKNRLQLLYPGQYDYSIRQEERTFSVNLQLQLT